MALLHMEEILQFFVHSIEHSSLSNNILDRVFSSLQQTVAHDQSAHLSPVSWQSKSPRKSSAKNRA